MLPTRAGLTNASLKILGAGLNFLLVPWFLRVYGIETYGALSLLLAVSQYLGVLDLGLTGTLVQECIKLRGGGDQTYFRLRGLAVTFLVVAGGALVLPAAGTAWLWGPLLHLDHVDHLWLGVLGVGWITISTLISSCLSSAYVATLRFGYVNIFNIARNILPQVVTVIAYMLFGSLGLALGIGATASGAVVGSQAYLLRREEHTLRREGVVDPSRAVLFVRESISFSAQTLLAIVLMPVVQTVVGMKLGSQANALLDISRRLLFAGRQVLEALFVPMFARASQLRFRGAVAELRRLAAAGMVASVIAAFAFYVVVAVVLRPILDLWLGSAAASQVAPVARLLLVGVALTCPHIGTYQVLSSDTDGRIINIVAGVVSVVVMCLALLPSVDTLAGVLRVYSYAALAGAMITLVAATVHLGRLQPVPDRDRLLVNPNQFVS